MKFVWQAAATLVFAVLLSIGLTTSTVWGSETDLSSRVRSIEEKQTSMKRHIALMQQQVTLLQKENSLLRWELSLLKREQKRAQGKLSQLAKKAEGNKQVRCKPGQPPKPKADNKQVKQLLQNPSGPSKGPRDAKVTILEFLDFECPFCKRGADTMKRLQAKYKKDIRVVVKHLPLSFHKNAHLAAQAAMVAHKFNRFWSYYDKLFHNYRNLNKASVLKFAKEVGLDSAAFKKELDSGKFKALVDRDLKLARKLGVHGTPTFFVNGQC